MIPLTGYADRLSVRPGETISFKISSSLPDPYDASLVRIRSADPNPDGPGLRETTIDASFSGPHPSRTQPLNNGSYARIDETQALSNLDTITLTATIWPTLPGKGDQSVLSWFDSETGKGIALCLNEDGAAEAWIGQPGDGEPFRLSTHVRLKERVWARVWLSFDQRTGQLTVGQTAFTPAGYVTRITENSDLIEDAEWKSDAPILIAALGKSAPSHHFNGKIEHPQIHGRALMGSEIAGDAEKRDMSALIAHWDFSQDIPTTGVTDTGSNAMHGRLINMPARAMTGSNWSGREMCWRHAPEEYAAIHFHDDDIHDCGWETDFTYTVPDDLPSGLYAARLACGEHADAIPFVVAPPKGERKADICVVIPTFTYVIYGNHARRDFSDAWQEKAAQWGAFPHNPADHPDYGHSTYNFHRDGSGICHASSLRPLLTLRPGYFTFADTVGSGLRHLQADTHLIDWLDEKEMTYDLVTDQELHDDGAAALSGYRTVLTTSHPEYHTRETLDALESYRDGGGRLIYLGGNGFYWKVALHADEPGVIEIRRGEGGIRAWAAEPGEYYNAFDGEYGGLWRRNGRAPQRLAGVGFSAQGTFEGSYYVRKPTSRAPRFAWAFDGIEDDKLGDFGLSGGGAAGFELDRADTRLGTPEDAAILARSTGHSDNFVLVPEEHLTHQATWAGEDQKDLIRAEIVFFETGNGGAVFSVGSITFCGSLFHNNYDNSISRLLENVINRFLDPDPYFNRVPDEED